MPTIELGRLQVLVELVDRMSPAIDDLSSKVREVTDNIVGMSDDTKKAWQDAGRIVGEQVSKFAETADQLVAMSEKTGVGIEALQRLKFAAEQSGTGLNQVVNAIGQMSRRLGGEGGKAVNAALDEIGVSLDKLKGMSPEQAFLTIAEAIDKMPPSFDRTKAAADIFGNRVGQEIIPMVTGKLRELMDQAPVTAEANVRAMADAGDAYEGASARLDASLGNLIGSLVQKIGPDISAIGSAFGTLLSTLAPLTPALVALWPTLVTVGTYIGGALVTAVGAVLSPIGLVVAAVVGLGLVWYTWGEDIKRFVSGAYLAVKEWLWDKFGAIVTAVQGFLTTMKGYWETFKGGVTTVVTETAATTKSFLVDKFEDVKGGVQTILQGMQAFWDAHKAAVSAVLGLVIDAVTGFVQDLKDWLGPKIKAVFEATKAIINLILDYHVAMITAVTTKISEWFTDLREWFGAKLRAIITGVKAIVDLIVPYFVSIKDRVIATAKLLYEGVLNWLVTQFQNIVTGIKSKIDAVTGFFSDMYQKVVGGSIVPDMINAIGQWFGPRLQSAMVEPTRTATGEVVTVFNEMPEKINFQELINKWGTALEGIEGKTRTFKETLSGIWEEVKQTLSEKIDGIKEKFLDALTDMITGQGSFRDNMATIWEEIKQAVVRTVLNMIANILTEYIRAIGIIKNPLVPGGPPGTQPPGGGGGGTQPPNPEEDRRSFFAPGFLSSAFRGSTTSATASNDSRIVQALLSIDRRLADRPPAILFVPMKPGDTMASLETRMADQLPRRIMQSAQLRNAMQRAILGAV